MFDNGVSKRKHFANQSSNLSTETKKIRCGLTQDFDLEEMEEKSKNGRERGEFRLTGHLGAW